MMIFGHESWRNMGCIHFNQHTYYLLIDGWPKWQHNRAHLRMMYEGRFENLKFLRKYKFFGGGGCMVFFVLDQSFIEGMLKLCRIVRHVELTKNQLDMS
jgi:hypothetical protein